MLKSQKGALKKLTMSYYLFGNAWLETELLGQSCSSSAESNIFSNLEKLPMINSDDKWIKNKQYLINLVVIII